MKRLSNLTQAQRLAALTIDLLIIAAACFYLFGTAYPPFGEKGFWAYSALLAILVGSKLVTPFYVKPVDAISYAVPAFVSLMLVNDWTSWSPDQRWGFSLAAILALLISLLGVANIVVNSLRSDWAKELSNRMRIALDLVAQPRYIYSPLILFAVFSYHRDEWLEAVIILIVTGATIWEFAGNFFVWGYLRIRTISNKALAGIAGHVVAFQDPGIVLLRQQFEGDIKRNDLLFISDKHGPKKLVVALDYVGRSEGILIRAVELKTLSTESQARIGTMAMDECAYHLDLRIADEICRAEGVARDAQARIVGIVAPDTSIERLHFEVVDNSELAEGRLVSAYVGTRKVLYQIVAGLTKEEIVQQKNTYGYLRGQAQQIGVWDENLKKFLPCDWLPTLNTPVYLEQKSTYQVDAQSIGHFPGSNFHASLKSVSDLVTHNTAILGILGIGKTMLAIELVERIMAEGIKVICLDLTNQYAQELSDFYDSHHEKECLAKLLEASAKDRDAFNNNPEEGGSIPHLREAIFNDVAEFLDPQNARRLKIYNPGGFVATKQQREPSQYKVGPDWHSRAGLFSVTSVEIAQIISEAALAVLSNEMSAKARACLVYEEAHSLVPEWNSVVNEGDKNATSGTARAILQGRKYGLGCLLVTQRTANVTKTILNQCNTVFAMRTFDETGKEFLANYIGRDYADALSSLPERHAVFFGKASSCENPVLIRLNNQDDFRTVFRAVNPPPPLPSPTPTTENVAQAGASANQGEPEFDDDIPF